MISLGIGIPIYKAGASGGGTPPENVVAPVLSGTQSVGATLTATSGTWTGTEPITYSYVFLSTVDFVNFTVLQSGASNTYVVQAADATKFIRCNVLAQNGFLPDGFAVTNYLFIGTARTSAFVLAAGITNQTQVTALNTLDTSLISAGLLPSGTGSGKIKAAYPLVGGTASTHKFNFVNPLDTDAAFRLAFFGGWTHNANGITSNGSNTYANTFFNPTTQLTNYNAHSAAYCRTQTANAGFDLGTTNTGNNSEFLLASRRSSVMISGLYDFNNAIGQVAASGVTDARGFVLNSVVSNINHRMFRNGTQVGSTNTNTNTTTPASLNIFLGAVNNNNSTIVEYTSQSYAFFSIGDGLTPAEITSYYNAVQAFNTSLSRQV